MSTSPLFILYGSATGNAEHIAKDLASRVPGTICCEMDQFKKKGMPLWETVPSPEGSKHRLLLITSTTGNGDAPENASRFVRFLKRKTTDATTFQHCVYAVLGLGDTNYDKFCQAGKDVDRRLHELGGTRCRPLACADEGTGLEDVVEPWTATILEEITNAGLGKQTPTTTKMSKPGPDAAKATHTENSQPERNGSVSVSAAPTPQSIDEKDTSIGVKIVRSLLSNDSSDPLEPVDPSLLPPLTTSISSCELIHHVNGDDEVVTHRNRSGSLAETMSSASSSTLNYNMQKPFDSQILHARYLTKTPNDAAKEVAELQVKGDDKDDLYKKSINEFERRFPLAPNNGTVPGKSGESTVAKNGKRVMELTLRLPDDYTLEYAPGDSLGLLVNNPPATVAFILGMLEQHSGLKRDQKISVDGDQPLTAEQIVRSKIDLSSPLKNKRILASLAQFATCPTEAFALQWLASKSAQGQKAFDEYIDKQKITVADLLRDFPSCQSITMEGLVSILPCVPPRYYSVSSSPLSHQNESLTIAFSVVDYVTPSLVIGDSEYGCKRIHGVATTMMEMLCAKLICGKANGPHDTLPIFPKPTAEFRMPATLSTPLILIGPGTGVAPFIGFLQHRQAMMSSSESEDVAHKVVEGTWRGGMELDENEVPVGQSDASGLSVAVDFRAAQEMGSVDLFFGCRHEDHDWLYREEMVAFKERGILSQLYTAFSRGKEKQYVQDVMRAEPCRSRIIRLITKMDACVYLCGDGNVMAKDVQAAVVEMLSSDMKGGLDEAVSYLETMKRKKRFVMDIWS